MNPDENNTNQEGNTPVEPPVSPEAPTTPENPSTPETPNLDQVAADLANTNPADMAPDAMSATESVAPATESSPEPTAPAPFEPSPEAASTPVTPEASTMPETLVAPEVPVAPESPATPAPATPEVSVAEALAMPESSGVPEMSDPATPAPATPEAPTTPETPAAPEMPSEPETPSTDFSTGASFVNDTPASDEQPAEASATNAEDEAPLVPADPVPGSIGSALAYSDTAPDHAVPVGKPSRFKLSFGKKSQAPTGSEASAAEVAKPGRKPLTKENLKLLIAIVGGVALVAVIAVIIFFILNSGSKSSTTRPADDNSSSNTPTNTVSSLTCTRSGDATVFSNYSSVVSGDEQIIAMYSNDTLSSFGSTLKLTFADEEAAKAAQLVERDSYSAMVRSAGLTDDPFTSSYDTNGITMTVTHQAEGEDIDSKTARILGFYVVKGEPATDIDTLLDTYETDGYTCVEK